MANESDNTETLDPDSSSPNKRIRTLNGSSPSPKGKVPMEELNEDSSNGDESPTDAEPQFCGICWLGGGNTVRGYIDSCDHYFCFICILEWSKIESRCPLCRARFSTIRRMRKDGSFVGSRPVRVPVRDQIPDPLGNTALDDPYVHATCSICDGGADESVILLCDLCDSAAHTYCVGLGWTVPEDDWYCEGCSLLKAEELDGEGSSKVEIPATSGQPDDVVPSAPTPVSIFDIVRESPDRTTQRHNEGTERLLNLTSRENWESSSNLESSRPGKSTAGKQPKVDARMPHVESGARTLNQCRNVHLHIRALRSNWGALRKGSLSFTRKVPDANARSSRKVNDGTVSSRALESHSSAEASQPTVSVRGSSGGDISRSYDVSKAWKTFKMAKSLQQVPKKKSSISPIPKNFLAVPAVPKNLLSGVNVQKDVGCSNGKVPNSTGLCGSRTALQPAVGSNKMGQSSRTRNSRHEKDQKGIKLGSSCSIEPSTALSRGNSELSTTKNAPGLIVAESAGKSCQKMVESECRVPSLICEWQGQSSCSSAPGESVPRTSPDASSVLPQTKASPSTSGRECDVGKKFSTKNVSGKSKSKVNEGTKEEVASLVKLNLSIIRKKKKLDYDVFKEIARLSTHSILAACGHERKKTSYSFPAILCSHMSDSGSNQKEKVRKFHLMPNTCRECFYGFVKDVVNTILRDKAGHTTRS